MKNNVKEVLDSLQEIATVQMADFIGKAEYSAEVTTSSDKDYPLLNYFITGTANIQDGFMEVPLAMRFLDVVGGLNKQRDRDKEVKSDMIEVASMFVEAMEDALLIQPQTVAYEAIYINYGAGLSGVELNLTLSIKRPCDVIIALPLPPNAPNVNLFTFEDFENVSILTYCSDPDGLALELESVGKPDYGTIELTANDIIKWTKEGATDVAQGIVEYTIKNTAGLEDTGRLTLAFEEIDITIDTPTEGQEIPSDEDVTVSFTVTPATQDYISAIALVVDGVETVKRTPYSTADFTIDAGTLADGNHTILLRAYDLDDNLVESSDGVTFEVVASFTPKKLIFDGFNEGLILQDSSIAGIDGLTGTNFTVLARYKRNTFGTQSVVFRYLNTSESSRFMIRHNSGNRIFPQVGLDRISATSFITYSDTSKFYNIGFSGDGTTSEFNIIVDNINTGVGTNLAAIYTNEGGFIAFNGANGDYNNIELEKIAVWNKQLTQQEVDDFVTLEADSISPANLVFDLRSGDAIWDGTKFILVDRVNNSTWHSQNMEETDLQPL